MAAFIHRLSGGESRTVDGRLDAIEQLLAGVSRNGDTLLFSGMNVQVVNGMGQTRTKNTLGNVIIGYNEWTSFTPVYRGGSHYLVIGDDHQYRSWAGIVAGLANTVSGPFASVLGGASNTAGEHASTVTGGYANTATGYGSTIAGGYANTASGGWSSVTGGYANSSSGDYSTVTGGRTNETNGDYDVVVGGDSVNCGIPGNTGVCGEGYWYATD